ncbi:hypothetical protein Syun_009771 [Stephania yunnanensis]|uniref:Wax synthase domain-containing protein n=1 Tax=Stephania yunnanensis TaxID=152371 RepID=A0AAP0PPC5_9MAGN
MSIMDDGKEHLMNNICKAWIAALASLTYSYYISKTIKPGIIRLISLLPIITLFTLLPLTISPSPHLCGITAFFLTWLANFKLLLFAFNKGPLSSSPISLIQFISIASLPIKVRQSQNTITGSSLKSPLINYALKFLLLVLVLRIYQYRSHIHPQLLLVINCAHLYLTGEILLALFAAPARVLLKFEIEPQFNEPYLSTSLQDFWGRRWNLMVTSILRPSVYEPVRLYLGPVMGKRWATACATLVSFVVSGLMHELIYYYVTRVKPTWEVSWFFVVHGVCTAIEVLVKKSELGEKWRLNRVVSGVLTIGFVIWTSFWLFFPQIVRNGVDLKVIEEHGIAFQFVKEQVSRYLM